jgi:hypothetical protein
MESVLNTRICSSKHLATFLFSGKVAKEHTAIQERSRDSLHFCIVPKGISVGHIRL